MNAEDAKVPNTEGAWSSIEIFLFSNGQQYSPPRKYHLDAEELNWWDATLNQLARSHYGVQHPQIYLYTIDGQLVQGPLELKDGQAYVAVQPPEEFIDAGYQKYLLKASRSWERRQARKKGCCYEDCTGYKKDIDRSSLESIEPLMPATKQPDWRSPGGNFVTTVRPKPETGIYYPNDYGLLNKSGTISHPEPKKVYETEPYDTKPTKQESGTDLRRDDDNSSKTSNQKHHPSRPRNSDGVQRTDYNGESNNPETWTNTVAPKSKPDDKERKQSLNDGFQIQAERILGSMDRGFQERNYDEPLDEYDTDESTAGSMYTHGTWSFTNKPRLSDYGSRTNEQRAKTGVYESRDPENVAELSKDKSNSEENGKREIKMDKNGIKSSANSLMSTERRNKSFERENIPFEPINTGMENLRDNEIDRDNRMREEMPEKNYSEIKANEFIRKAIDSREKSAEARNKGTEKDGNTPLRQTSEIKSNDLEYKGKSTRQKGSENEYIRKLSQQKARDVLHGNKAGESKNSDNENVIEYNNTNNKYEQRMSELNSNGLGYRGQPSEKRDSGSEYLRNLSQQKPRDEKNGNKIGERRSLDNENISEYINAKNKNDRRMSEQKSNGIEYKGQPSVQRNIEDEYIAKLNQQSKNGMNGSKLEEPRNSFNENISEYNNNIENKFGRRLSELKKNGLDHKGQASEQRGSENEYIPSLNQQKPRNGVNGNKVEAPRSSFNEDISEYNNAENKFKRRISDLKRNGLDHKGQVSEQRGSENEYMPKASQLKPRNGMNANKVEEPRSSLNEDISEHSNADNKFRRRISELKRNGLDHKGHASKQRDSENEYITKLSQQKPRNGMNGSNVEEPRSSFNENISEYTSEYNADNKFERRMNELKSNSIDHRGQLSHQRGRENENLRKSNQQKSRDGIYGSKLRDPRSSVNENISQHYKTENKNERRTSELKNNSIEYKGQPSEQRGRENEHIRKLSQQKPRNGMNGSKAGEPRSSVNENTGRINESRLKYPERNNRVSVQKIKESDIGSRFGQNHSKGGDLRIRGGSGQDTERKSSVLKTADHRTKPFTAGARTSIKDKTNPRPRIGVPPLQVDEPETPLADTDINNRLGGPNPIVNDVDKISFQPAISLDSRGGNKTTGASHNTEMQNSRKSSLSTGKSSNRNSSAHKIISHRTQNPLSNVPNQSEEKLVTKDTTNFVFNELEKQNLNKPVVPSPTVDFGTTDTKKGSSSITNEISNQRSLATDSIPIENTIGDKEIIIISTSLLRNPETEIASMTFDSVKHVINDIKDAPNQVKTGLLTIQQSVKSIPVNEGVQTYAEVCDAAEQHGHGVVEYNTTKMQWAFSNLPSLRESMVATNEKENVISILNKGDIVNLKLNIEVINGDRSVISSQITRKSRSLTNIVTTEKGSQITIDDDLYVQSKSLQSLLNEETCKGSGFEGHPKVVVVQCACCDRLNNSPRIDLPACCDSKKYIVLLPSSPQHAEDRCNCELRQPHASSLQCDAKRMSSSIPIKKTYSDMALETAAINKKDTGRLIAVINSTSQTEDSKSECLVTKHKVSITEDSLKCEFRKESVSQISMATHATCDATCTATCHALNTCPKLHPQVNNQAGSKIFRGVLKQCPQTCPQKHAPEMPQDCQKCSREQSKHCPRMQSQNCPQENSQNCSQQPQFVCCPQTCPHMQSQCCPDTCQQVPSQGCPQTCQNQTQSQAQTEETSHTCPPVQLQESTRVPSQTCCKDGPPTRSEMQAEERSQPEVATTCQQMQPQGCLKICPLKIIQVGPPEQLTNVCVQVGPLPVQVPSHSGLQGQQDVSHTHTQTQWCCVMITIVKKFRNPDQLIQFEN